MMLASKASGTTSAAPAWASFSRSASSPARTTTGRPGRSAWAWWITRSAASSASKDTTSTLAR
jgi:hypothetical protein